MDSTLTNQLYLKYIKKIIDLKQKILTIHRTRNCVDDIARTVMFDGG